VGRRNQKVLSGISLVRFTRAKNNNSENSPGNGFSWLCGFASSGGFAGKN